MNRLKLITAALLLFACGLIHAQTAVIPVYSCTDPGVRAVTAGLPSSNYLQGVVPACTVTVYLTGTTTPATIYKNSTGTAQNNPFTANSDGSIPPIYAATGVGYDVKFSGGIPPNIYLSAVTLTGLTAGGSGGGGGGSFTALTGDATSTSTGGATTVEGLNGTNLASLGTGLLTNTNGTGVPSITPPNVTVGGVLCSLGGSCAPPITCGGSASPCFLQQINPTVGPASTTTTATITPTTTSIPVASCSGFTFAPAAIEGISLAGGSGIEWVVANGCASNVLNVTQRAFYYTLGGSGQSAYPWPSGSKVIQMTQGVSLSSGLPPTSYTLANGAQSFGSCENNTNPTGICFGAPVGFNAGATMTGFMSIAGYTRGNGLFDGTAITSPNSSAGSCQTNGLLYLQNTGNYTWFSGAGNSGCNLSSDKFPANSYVWVTGTPISSPALGSVPQAYLTQLGEFSAQTGFQIGGTAPNGHCLVGNGVDYVDSSSCGGAGAYVALNPGTGISQNITQPSGTFLGQTPATLITATPSTTLNPLSWVCAQPSWDVGNNGTSGQGWGGCSVRTDSIVFGNRGIDQLQGLTMYSTAIGDRAMRYAYEHYFGGNIAASDEAITPYVDHISQMGYITGNALTGIGLNPSLITVNGLLCNGDCITQPNGAYLYADGGIAFDRTQPLYAGTIADGGNTMGALYFDLTGVTLPVSRAWGSFAGAGTSVCTNNSNGQYQNYTNTTCTVTLGTSPASPNHFISGTNVCLVGPNLEEAAVTAVTTGSTTDTVTFSTRYAWNNGQNVTMMQGGTCGESFTNTAQINGWPISYFSVGSTTTSRVIYGNCITGNCGGGGNLLPNAPYGQYIPIGSYGASVSRVGNVVTVNYGSSGSGTDPFPVGSTVVVTGATPSDFNGTFTVATNTMDNQNPIMTWAQTGANETATGTMTFSGLPAGITLFPACWIIGTNGGVQGDLQCATNHMNVASGDSIVGAPTSQYSMTAQQYYIGQTTPQYGGGPSSGIHVTDNGPSDINYAFVAQNNANNGVANGMFDIEGSYTNVFHIGYRPGNNGTLLYVEGNEPVSSNSKPYYIFADHQAGSGLSFIPATGTYSFGFGGSGKILVNSITAYGGGSATSCFATNGSIAACAGSGGSFVALTGDAMSAVNGGATTVNGLEGHALPSLSTGYLNWNGTAWVLSAGGGGGGTVTTVGVTTANGISGTVANATTTPAITLALGAITPSSVVATGTVAAPAFSINGATNITSTSSANSQVVTCPTGGTGTQVCDASGAWIANGGGSGISGLTSGFIPLAGSATTLTGNSNLDDGVTNAGAITSAEPVVVNGSVTSNGVGNGFDFSSSGGYGAFGDEGFNIAFTNGMHMSLQSNYAYGVTPSFIFRLGPNAFPTGSNLQQGTALIGSTAPTQSGDILDVGQDGNAGGTTSSTYYLGVSGPTGSPNPGFVKFSNGIALSETSTAVTPAAGIDTMRADSATHSFKCSYNGGAETACVGGGSSGISGLTSGYIPLAGSPTTLTGNSHIDDGVTTAATLTATEKIVAPAISTTGTAGVASPLSFAPGTTLPTLPAGYATFLGPNASSITAYGLQLPSTITAAGILHIGAPSSGVSQITNSLVSLSADVTGNLPNANLASQTANTVLGSLTATTPSGLAMPSCSGATNALTWTTGTGFGCNTISGGATFPDITDSAGTIAMNNTTATGVTTLNIGTANTGATANIVINEGTNTGATAGQTVSHSVYCSGAQNNCFTIYNQYGSIFRVDGNSIEIGPTTTFGNPIIAGTNGGSGVGNTTGWFSSLYIGQGATYYTNLKGAASQTGNVTLTSPLLTGSDTLATIAATQTLTNKSIALSEVNSGYTAGCFLGASSTTAAACTAYTAYAIPKMASTATTPVASSILDNGTDVVTTEPSFSASGSTTLTPASGIGTTVTSTGIAFPPTYATTARVYRGTCHMIWQQVVGISTIQFFVGNSVAPTAEYVTSFTAMGTYVPPYVAANITTTTTTAVTTTVAPAGFGTAYTTDISVMGSFTAAANTVTIYAQSGSATDTVTIQPGSYCTWLP